MVSAVFTDRERIEAYDVEPVDVGFVHPALHDVGHLLRRADGCGAQPPDGDMLAHGLLGPFGDFGGGLGPALDGGPDGIALDMAQLLVLAVLVEINPRPAAKQRQRAIDRP